VLLHRLRLGHRRRRAEMRGRVKVLRPFHDAKMASEIADAKR
jgi:hypothetical protein